MYNEFVFSNRAIPRGPKKIACVPIASIIDPPAENIIKDFLDAFPAKVITSKLLDILRMQFFSQSDMYKSPLRESNANP
jgi:hypothetical protein